MCYTLSVFYYCATSHSETQGLKITAIIYFTHKTNLDMALQGQLSLASHGISWTEPLEDLSQDGSVTWFVRACWVSTKSSAGDEGRRPPVFLHSGLSAGCLPFSRCSDSKSKCPKRQIIEADAFCNVYTQKLTPCFLNHNLLIKQSQRPESSLQDIDLTFQWETRQRILQACFKIIPETL